MKNKPEPCIILVYFQRYHGADIRAEPASENSGLDFKNSLFFASILPNRFDYYKDHVPIKIMREAFVDFGIDEEFDEDFVETYMREQRSQGVVLDGCLSTRSIPEDQNEVFEENSNSNLESINKTFYDDDNFEEN
ncbi:hypothetical protein NHQ30_003080 [Ciborinia camelliae]|nr:hypothetical protein NHQ30_003080 [Ciborinia camelliae]